MTDVRRVLAPLLQVPLDEIDASTSLKRFSSSLERTKLELGLKRAGLELPAGPVGMDVGALEASLGQGGGAPAAGALVRTDAGPRGAIASMAAGGVGVDIESIAALPEFGDIWEHEFYKGSFTSAEIAAALLHEEPRQRLCGFWCAKEALRKVGASFAQLGWQEVQVAHRADGAPFLQVASGGTWTELPCRVSISHTAEVAIAVVMWTPAPAAPPVVAPAPAGAPPATGGSGLGATLIAVVALILSIAALVAAN